ncbi:MAG: class I SAM-dependent RNA methyltransferase, partial [Firmicutes bacterium]|nr:class I SAM-dependent RNA methyltransferase [Bacillota bacterium]
MEKNGQYSIEIFDVSDSGEGIGRIDGMVTFVPSLLPGDTATVEIMDIKKNLAKGRIVSIDSASSDRIEPPCEYFDKCGGCTLQNLEYKAQLKLKEKQLRDKLDRIYGGKAPEIEPIIGMNEPWRYRNKAVYSVNAGRVILNKDGSVRNERKPKVGFFDGKGRNIVECKSCLIQHPAAEKAADALREYIQQTRISIYDEKSKKGRLRQMIVRSGFNSGEVMVILVVNGRKIPKPELLADLMYDAIDSLNDINSKCENINENNAKIGAINGNRADNIDNNLTENGFADRNFEDTRSAENINSEGQIYYELKSLIINHNSNRSLAEISTNTEVLYGQSVISDRSAGLEFGISPFSFYQVNPAQMEKLYETVLEFADLKGGETVFDLYCGVGTIGLYCASKAKYVWGIESVKSAVIDANRNAVINGLVNIRFINGKAEEELIPLMEKLRQEQGLEMAEESGKNEGILSNGADINGGIEAEKVAEAAADNADEHEGFTNIADIVIMDPPRAGCKPELLEAVLKAAPEKIIYVSCDAGTFARDLKILTEGDRYEIKRIKQVDQFCQGVHTETVVMLSHKKPDSVINVKVEFGEGEGKVPLDNIAKRAAAYKPKERVTYKMIKEYIEAKYGFKVHTAYIAEVKRELGLPMY